MSNPTVSVIIPTYNHGPYLRLALKSVCEQTYKDWEAIVVNNYSEDNTVEIVESFEDSRIRLMSFKNNGVIAASRNYGIGEAKGKYVAFLDSDDIWRPEKIQKCIKHLESEQADVVCHAEDWVSETGEVRTVVYGPEKRASYRSLLFYGNCISTSATVVKKDYLTNLGGFLEDKDIITAEDYELWIRLANSGARLKFLSDVLGEYRIHSESNSQAIVKNTNAILNVIKLHYLKMDKKSYNDRILFQRAKAVAIYGGGRGLQKQGKKVDAFIMFMRSLATYPFVLKNYLAIILNLVLKDKKTKVGSKKVKII